jgi:hypothetical protein
VRPPGSRSLAFAMKKLSGTLLKNVTLVQKSSKTSEEHSFFAGCPSGRFEGTETRSATSFEFGVKSKGNLRMPTMESRIHYCVATAPHVLVLM